jgi:hypothetical protein
MLLIYFLELIKETMFIFMMLYQRFWRRRLSKDSSHAL